MASYKQYETQKGLFWEVRGYIGTDERTGESVRVQKKGFKTKKEAQLFYNEALLEFENQTYISDDIITFYEVYCQWLEIYKQDVKPSTLLKTEGKFRTQILPTLGKMRIQKISIQDLQRLVQKWSKQFKHYKQYFNYTKLIFTFAYKMGYIKHNVCDKVMIPKKASHDFSVKREKYFYTKQELNQFLTMAKEHDSKWYTFFWLLSFSGIRKGEALALTWRDVNFTNGVLSITKTVAEARISGKVKHVIQPPKTNKDREVALDKATLTILKEWKSKQAKELLIQGYNALDGQQLIFQNANNKMISLSQPRKHALAIAKKASLEYLHVHGFRHTHASLLFESGASIKDVQERLGHSDIKTTMNIYAHVTESAKIKTAEIFANFMAK